VIKKGKTAVLYYLYLLQKKKAGVHRRKTPTVENALPTTKHWCQIFCHCNYGAKRKKYHIVGQSAMHQLQLSLLTKKWRKPNTDLHSNGAEQPTTKQRTICH